MQSHDRNEQVFDQRIRRADSIVEGLPDSERYYDASQTHTEWLDENALDYWPSASRKAGVRTRKSTLDRGLRMRNKAHKRQKAQIDKTASKAIRRYSTQSEDF